MAKLGKRTRAAREAFAGKENWAVKKAILYGRGSAPHSLVLSADAVYSEEGRSVHAYSLADGKLLWQQQVSNAGIGPDLHKSTTNGGVHWGMALAGERLLVVGLAPGKHGANEQTCWEQQYNPPCTLRAMLASQQA